MRQLKIFIELTRLNKPIGFMLLFWPCSWGLALGYVENQNLNQFFYFIMLFLMGSVLMRSAGCIVNDIVDKNIDIKVNRTKKRPIASGAISIKQSLFYVAVLCFIAFLILIQFNALTIILGMSSMALAFSYPYMKRFTYWPQLFLGLTFNWGLIMAWVAMTNFISIDIIILYIAAIFWTLGYDTIYGVQDIFDDEIIGVKSTSIKFKDNIKLFVSLCYFVTSIIIIYLFYIKMNLENSIIFIIIFILSLIFQIKIFERNKPKKCLQAFKFNNFSGLIVFLGILSASQLLNF